MYNPAPPFLRATERLKPAVYLGARAVGLRGMVEPTVKVGAKVGMNRFRQRRALGPSAHGEFGAATMSFSAKNLEGPRCIEGLREDLHRPRDRFSLQKARPTAAAKDGFGQASRAKVPHSRPQPNKSIIARQPRAPRQGGVGGEDGRQERANVG